jgi:hypothetical protein
MSNYVTNFFGSDAPKRGTSNNFFARYKLPSNPFPPNRMIFPNVLHGQTKSVDLFRSLGRDVLFAKKPERRALAVLAGTGGGKTHFLRHCMYVMREASTQVEKNVAIVEFTAGSGKLIDLIREIYRSCDDLCRRAHQIDLPNALLLHLGKRPKNSEMIRSLGVTDLQSALSNLLDLQKSKSENFESAIQSFSSWFRGETLTAAEKKSLKVFSRVATATLATKILAEILDLCRQLGIIDGLMICIDEMESLFTKGLSQSQIQAFLQDLRFLYDELVRESNGISVFILSASTTRGADALAAYNYPIFQRLGYETHRALLEGIPGVVQAIEFANTYIDFFAEQYAEQHHEQASTKSRELLTSKDIQDAYSEALRESRINTVSQGILLDNLYSKVEGKRNTQVAS